MPTLFSKIISKEIPATILHEDDDCIAFADIHPQAPVHLLIVPRKEIATVNDVQREDAELIGKLFLVAKSLAKKFGVDETGYRLVINCNDDGGQTVKHLHIHLLGGRKLGWPPG